MEAPKEIWLLPDIEMHDGLSILWYEAPYCTGAIEYIRTDAFIEKAEKFLETYPHMFMGVMRTEMIEDFKEYLKK